MKLILANRQLTILFASTFLFFTNEALFLPTLPLHLAAYGYDNFRIGTVLGAFALGVLLARPLTGYVADRIGRKAALGAGVFFFFASPVFYLFSLDFIYLLVIRFVHGLGIAFYTTGFPAYVTDTAAEENRGEVMGHMATSTTMAFILGPLIGTSVYKGFGFTALVWLCTLTGLINLILILQIRESRSRDAVYPKPSYRTAVLRRSIIVSSGIEVVYGMIFGGMMTFLPLLLNRVDGGSIGMYFMVESAAVILFRFAGARLADQFGRGPVFSYSFITILFAVFLTSKITGVSLLVFVAILFGLGSALCAPALTAFVADRADPDARGMVFSVVYAAFDTGVIGAGIILGFLADLVGLRLMFAITAAFGGISLVLFSFLVRKGIKNSLSWSLLPKRQS